MNIIKKSDTKHIIYAGDDRFMVERTYTAKQKLRGTRIYSWFIYKANYLGDAGSYVGKVDTYDEAITWIKEYRRTKDIDINVTINSTEIGKDYNRLVMGGLQDTAVAQMLRDKYHQSLVNQAINQLLSLGLNAVQLHYILREMGQDVKVADEMNNPTRDSKINIINILNNYNN